MYKVRAWIDDRINDLYGKLPYDPIESSFRVPLENEKIEKEWRKKHRFASVVISVYNFIAWRVPRFFMETKYHPKRVKRFFQRAIRGYDDATWWCLGSSTIDFVLPNLRILRDNFTGYPAGLHVESVSTEEDDEGSKQWRAMLDEMIFAFDMLRQIDNHDIPQIRCPENEEINQRFLEEGHYERLPTEEEYKRMKEGLKLFMDNILTLWD